MKKYIALFLLSFVLVTPTFAASRTCPNGTTENPDYDPQDEESEECIDVPVVPDSEKGLNCIKAALQKRDTAVIAAFNLYSTTAVASIQKRSTDLTAAWDTEKGSYRKADIRDVWSAYKKELRIAKTKLRVGKKAAWDTFRKEKSACKNVQVADDTQSSSADTSL